MGRTWLRRETVDEAVWRGAQPAMHLVIPQHSKAARRHRVPSDLRIAIKAASSMRKVRLEAAQTGLAANMYSEWSCPRFCHGYQMHRKSGSQNL